MIVNYKYRLYPDQDQEQESKLDQQFFVANQAWNHALSIRIEEIKEKNGFINFNDLYKNVMQDLLERKIKANSGIVQQTLRNFESTLKYYFRNKDSKGFPKFKVSSLWEQSFEFKNQGIHITENYFKILKMKINWKYHRELPSRPKKVVIKRESDGKYYVIFSVEVEKEELPKTKVDCAIDMNIDNIAIAESTGKAYLKTIIKLEKYNEKYKKLQKKLSKRYAKGKKGKNTKKLQKKQNKIHKKVRNVKENFFHNFSKFLVENFDSIRAEKLEKKDMKENAPSRKLRRSIAEVSWNSLIQKLKYKTERYGKVFEEINPAYTSQRCNRCGYISQKNRTSQSIFHCKKCGHRDNADCNAARNILDYDSWKEVQVILWERRGVRN